jgi:hypothetical protein
MTQLLLTLWSIQPVTFTDKSGVRRNHGRLRFYGFIERAPERLLPSTFSAKARLR